MASARARARLAGAGPRLVARPGFAAQDAAEKPGDFVEGPFRLGRGRRLAPRRSAAPRTFALRPMLAARAFRFRAVAGAAGRRPGALGLAAALLAFSRTPFGDPRVHAPDGLQGRLRRPGAGFGGVPEKRVRAGGWLAPGTRFAFRVAAWALGGLRPPNRCFFALGARVARFRGLALALRRCVGRFGAAQVLALHGFLWIDFADLARAFGPGAFGETAAAPARANVSVSVRVGRAPVFVARFILAPGIGLAGRFFEFWHDGMERVRCSGAHARDWRAFSEPGRRADGQRPRRSRDDVRALAPRCECGGRIRWRLRLKQGENRDAARVSRRGCECACQMRGARAREPAWTSSRRFSRCKRN